MRNWIVWPTPARACCKNVKSERRSTSNELWPCTTTWPNHPMRAARRPWTWAFCALDRWHRPQRPPAIASQCSRRTFSCNVNALRRRGRRRYWPLTRPPHDRHPLAWSRVLTLSHSSMLMVRCTGCLCDSKNSIPLFPRFLQFPTTCPWLKEKVLPLSKWVEAFHVWPKVVVVVRCKNSHSGWLTLFVPSSYTGSQPNTPISPGFPGGIVFPQSAPREDPAQGFIKQRQQEAEEQKRRLLAAYDYVSKTGAGKNSLSL